jgi:eukaryotic-like serine/threonine-protein kinase
MVPSSTHCPTPTRLQTLLDGALSPLQQADLTAHLDGCGECQQALERLADGGSGLERVVQHADRDRPPMDSAYWHALADLEDAANGATVEYPALSANLRDTPHPHDGSPLPPSSLAGLEFLQPTDTPGMVGRIDRFEVAHVVGRGGMGVVVKAFDGCLERSVALKLLEPRFARDETARARFCREARAAASITHEHVVAVHHVEEDEASGLPYLVMQLVEGESLQDRLDRVGPLPLADVVRIGMQTAYGLSAAHAGGLIHRDIKPANILLERGTDHVKLTDFGLARAAEDIKLTQTGFVAGTPHYMAPEQARGEALDHRADLFSLGSVLFVMCTGKPPFDGSSPYMILRCLTEEEAPPAARINPAVPDWLDDLIGRLLAKDPTARIQSAAEVAETLALRLSEATRAASPAAPARPPTAPRSRSAPPTRRWRSLLLGLGLFLLGAAVGVLATCAVAGVTHVFRPAPSGPSAPETPADTPPLAILEGNVGPVRTLAFTPDGQTLAVGADDGSVKIWDVARREVRLTLPAHKGPVWSVAFGRDGTLASGGDDGFVRLWQATSFEESRSIVHAKGVRALAFSPDGRTLAIGGRDGALRLWDVAGGQDAGAHFRGHEGMVMALAFSLDGKTLLSASGDKTAILWDVASGREKVTLRGHTGGVYAVAFAPDGRTVLTGGWDRTARLWDAGAGSPRGILEGHDQDVWGVAFAPDGATLATASEDRQVRLWDPGATHPRRILRGHTGALYAIAFAPDGSVLASGSRDGSVRLWER